MKSVLRLAALALTAALHAPASLAFTDKPVRLIVPAPPGGTMDVMARIVADELAREIKQPVIVENRPGAGGAIAVKYMLSQPADGQTLMVTASNILSEIPHVLNVGYDPLKDVKPISVFARSTALFIAAPQFPAKDAKEAIAYVKANPGKVSFASYGAGTASHYAGAMLNKEAQLDMQHVPFVGSAPALTQVMGGQIPLMFDGYVTSKGLVNAGKVRLLAVAAKSRLPDFPNVPTMAELGYPEIHFSNWIGVIGSSQLPAALTEKIHTVLQKVGGNAAVQERMTAAGFQLVTDMPLAQVASDLRQESQRSGAIVKAFNIKLD